MMHEFQTIQTKKATYLAQMTYCFDRMWGFNRVVRVLQVADNLPPEEDAYYRALAEKYGKEY